MRAAGAALLVVVLAMAAMARADVTPTRSITDNSIQWSGWSQLWAVLTLRDYNTRVVVVGVTCLGVAGGLVGSFVLLRKRALLGDALSHATLPGIAIAFLTMSAAGGTGKSLPGLLLGATIAGVLGVLAILAIVHLTRIKEDAALGIVLSVFFGLGMALLGIIQNLNTGHAAGLKSFIYGKAASMLASDAWTIAIGGALASLACVLLFKEFALLCFDQGFAGAQGWPVILLDMVLMGLVVAVTVIGLQAVGLILVIALLVIPAAAARFWTFHLPSLVGAAALIGGASGLLGALISALLPRMPSGAVVVLVAGLVFLVSLVLGPARGILRRSVEQRRLSRTVARQHLLRAMHELTEPNETRSPRGVAFNDLLAERSWDALDLRRAVERARREGLIREIHPAVFALTAAGAQAAWRTVRNHRLWELYLITHADIAPSHVDRDADQVEHILDAGMIAEIEALLVRTHPDLAQPASPHRLAASAARPIGGPP